MKKIKVLYFVDRLLIGGIQTLITEWATRFDKDRVEVDFLVLDDGKKYELEEKLESIGFKIFKLKNIWIKTPFDFIKYRKALNSFFKDHNDYKVVHLHSSSKNYIVLKYAKRYKIPIRIAHSHSIAFQTENPLKKLIGKLMRKPLVKYSTNFFACSKIAGEWLFGKKVTNSNKFKVIHNAIDYEKFKYDEEIRKRVRKKLDIKDDEILIGHVGRFISHKNHKFLIEIFNEVNKINDKTKLIMIGTGSSEEETKEKVRDLKLQNKIIFAGFKTNVNEYMQAMDLFIMPSLLEGLGLVLIEAQASGIPCFASKDVIPIEAKATSVLSFISLNESASCWANKILNTDIKRINTKEELKKSNYFINDIVTEIMDIYMGWRR